MKSSCFLVVSWCICLRVRTSEGLVLSGPIHCYYLSYMAGKMYATLHKMNIITVALGTMFLPCTSRAPLDPASHLIGALWVQQLLGHQGNGPCSMSKKGSFSAKRAFPPLELSLQSGSFFYPSSGGLSRRLYAE